MSTEQKDYNLSPKEFARLVGVSSSTVRRWEEENVFTSVRTASGYRKFALSDVPRAKEYKTQISALKKQKSQEHIYSRTTHQVAIPRPSRISQFIFKRAALLSIAVLALIITASAIATYPSVKSIMSSKLQAKSEKAETERANSKYPDATDVNVLAAESSKLARSIISNIGWNFKSTVQIEDLQVNGPSVFLADIDAQGQNLDLGTGRITASNVLYGIQAGEGISIAGQTQTPLITNIDPGSAQEIFKNIKVGSSTITAETNTDTITFEQGSGITLSVDGKKITIASSQSGYAYWTTEVDGVAYDNIEDGSAVNFVSGDDITVTRSAANELTFNLQDVIDTVTGIDLTAGGYLNGTNATITFDNFSVDASGNIRIAAGSDFYIGSVNLGSTGLSSGASLVGVDGTNISQSASGDLQTVLENMSAAMGSGSSKWTIASNVIYPNNYSTVDFSLGGTSPSSAPFGMDIAQNILYLGDGVNDTNTPTIYFKASDGTNSGMLSYADSDRFVFTGGDVVVDGVIYAGSGVQQITLANGLLNPNALPLITSGTSPTKNSVSGFEVISNQIGLIRGCSNGEVLKWNSGTARWTCSPDSSGVSGVVDVQQDGATPPGSVDSQFDTVNFVNNFNLSENSSGVIDVDLGSNIGIGTAPSGSYALTVNGATNTSTLYLSGTQVTASANEINLLTGRTGTLLDTNNVASQLSAWDQNASDDVTAFTGLSDAPSSYSGQASKVVRVNAGGTGLEFIDSSSLGTNYWGRNSGSGYVYPSVVTDKVGIGNTSPSEELDVTGDIAVSGTVDGRDISADGSNLDTLYTTIGLSALTGGEVDQLENIGSTTISSTQWGYLGSLNQGLSTTDAVTFTTINTGQGAYELYAMDQNVRTSDTVQFAGLQIGGVTPTLSSIVSGTGTDWSGAVDTALATQLAIKSYVDAQVGGSSNAFENGLTESSNTVTLGGPLTQNTRLYDGSYEYLYMNTSTGNLGIGTTATGTHKLNVSGSFNTTTLYIAGAQVTSTAAELNLLDGVNLTLSAAEFNLLDGRSGTLLDTNNVVTQLSSWDQDSSNDLITTDIGSTVQGYNANTSFLGQTIESGEITDGTITGTDIGSGTITGTNIQDGTIGNVKLTNSNITITAGTGLSGGGTVSLGTGVTINSTLGVSIETGEITDGTILPGDIDDNSQTPTDGQVLTYNNANSKFNWVDATSLGTNYWGRNSGSGYVYPSVVTDKVGIGNTSPSESLDVTGNIAVSGTVDGRDISADGSNLDTLYTTIGLSALTSGEVDQLENIGTTTVSATQWGYLGSLNQSLSTTDAATFTTINTGQGAYELYAMDQNVRTSDTVQFAGLQIGGATPTLTSIVSGTGTDWSGAADTALATQLAIKSYVDSQVSGSAQNIWSTINADAGSTSANTTSDTLTISGAGSISTSISGDTLTITGTDNDTTYSAGSGLSLASTTFSLGGAISQPTRLYDGSYEYLYLNNSTGNVGIGTTSTGTYKLNVGGSLNTSTFYIAGTQVTATATEINLLSGRSGTLLDTNNVVTQLSAWDQNASNDLITTDLGVTVQGYNANTSFLGQTIEGSEITDGTITTSDLASTLTFASGAFVDLSSINYGSTAPQGLRLPNATSANLASYSPSSGVGYLTYDTDANKIKVFNGSAWTDISGASTTLQEAYEAGNSIYMTAAQGNLRVSNDALTELLFLDEATGFVGIGNTLPGHKLDVSGSIRIASGSDLYIGTTALSSTSGAGLVGVDSSGITNSSASILQTVLEDLDSAIGGVGSSSISAVGNISSGDAFTSGTPGSELYFTSSGVLGLGNTGSSAARIEFFNDTIDRISMLSAYVGIGTTAPATPLDVQGSIRLGASGGISDTLNTISGGTAPSASLYWGSYRICTTGDSCAGGAGGGVDSTGSTGYLAKFTDQYNVENSILFETGGSIGIGKTNPGSTLDVNGTAAISSNMTVGGTLSIGSNPAQSGALRLANNEYINARNNANTYDITLFGIDTSNNLVIGTSLQMNNQAIVGVYSISQFDSSKWRFDNSGNGYVSGTFGVGNTSPSESLDVTGNIAVSGTVDGRDISNDGSNLDDLYTTIGLSALTSTEVDQLENIGATTISATQWGYLGAMNQSVSNTDAVTFATINTGQGAYELYAMDQNVRTSDTVQFAGLQIGGATPTLTSIVSGTGTDWSGAVDTALATQIAIKSYVDAQVGGSAQNIWSTISSDSGSTSANTTSDTLTVNGAGSVSTSISGDTLTITGTDNDTTYSAGNDLDLSGTTFHIESQLDYVSVISRDSSNLTLQTTTSGDILLNPAGNVGVGTTATAFKLDVNGTFNATSLYIAGSQVTASSAELNLMDGVNLTLSAAEFNLLDGRSGTLLDTNNVATQLSAWDQDSSNDALITSLTSGYLPYYDSSNLADSTIYQSGGNVGIGTTSTGTYKVNVSGSLNTTTLYLAGTQISATATEINLLSGRSGTLLDTNNVATQLSAWDQDASNDLITTDIGSTVQGYNANTSLLGQTIETGEITDGTILPGDIDDNSQTPTDGQVLTYNNANSKFNWVDATSLGTNYWGRNSGSGYVYPSVVTDKVGIGNTSPSESLDVTGNIAVSGTVDGRDISADGSNLDTLYTTIGLSALTSGEVDQLENIGTTTVSATQWGYLGSLNQSLSTTDAATFTTINTGQGAYELYAMDQNVRTSDTVQFAGLQIGGATPTLSSIVSGTGTDWSGAADTALATQLAIKSYVDNEIAGVTIDVFTTFTADSGSTTANTASDTLTINGAGSVSTSISGDTLTITGTDNDTTYSAGSGLSLASTTFSLGGAISQPTRLYDGSYEYLYLNNSTGNVGIGTTSTGTYKLNVGGSLNTSTFYIAGTQVTSNASELNLLDGVNLTLSAAEFNLLDGRSGTLLDTNNVATQLSGWDQDNSNDALITSLTSGYLPYYDGANLANSIAYLTGANIGIGTTAPNTALEVLKTGAGDVEIARFSNTTAGGNAYITIGQTNAANDGAFLLYDSTSDYLRIGIHGDASPLGLVVGDGGNVGVGTTSTGTYTLNISGSLNTSSLYLSGTQVTSDASELNLLDGRSGTLLDTNNVATQLSSWDQDSSNDALITSLTSGYLPYFDGSNLANSAAYLTGGNIGIGITNPSSKLHVYNANSSDTFINVQGSNNTYSAGLNLTSGAGSTWNIITQQNYASNALLFGTGAPYSMALSTGGNLGIGTTNPQYSLDVVGDIRIVSGSELYSYGSVTLGGRAYSEQNYVTDGQTFTASIDALDQQVQDLSNGEAGMWQDQTGYINPINATSIAVTDTGRVGIGTTSPENPLSVVGNANITGNVGIGTTEVSTYALNVAGSANVTDLYIGGTQVSATATELNILSGATISTAELNYLDNSTVTNGGILFGDGSNFTQDAANFFWNDTSNRLGIGTTAPSATLDLFGTTAALQMTYDASNYGKFTVGNDGTLTLAGVSGGGSLTNIARFSTTGVDIDVPTSFNAAGDVSIANDLQFTNQTASYIKTLGPLTIEAGESYESNNLKLKTYNSGRVLLDASGGVALSQAQNWDLDSSTIALNFENGLLNLDTSNSRVGIGTTAPSAKLDVLGTGWIRGGTGNSGGIYVNGSGLVGIGTTNPGASLDVLTSTANAPQIAITENLSGSPLTLTEYKYNSSTTLGRAAGQTVNGVNTFYLYGSAGRQIALGANSSTTPNLLINSSGYVGVGTTSPSTQFSVGPSSQFQVDTNGNLTKINNVTYSWPGSQGGSNTILQNNGAGTLTWISLATAGIVSGTGTDNYLARWNSAGTGMENGTLIDNATTGISLNIDSSNNVGIGGTAASTIPGLYITASGNVGVGTTDPQEILSVNGRVNMLDVGSTASGNNLYASGGNLYWGTTQLDTGATATTLQSAYEAGNTIQLDATNGDFQITNDAGDELLFLNEATGNAGIGTTATGTYKLNVGGSLNATSLYLGGTQITSTANELNYLDNSTVTNGGILFADGSNFTQDAANFFWDNSSNYLGIGTTAPSTSLELFGATAGLQLSYDSSNYGKFTIGNDGTLTLAGVSAGGSLTNIARFATTGVNIDVPTSFNATGDVSIANDLQFTNQTASYIKSLGPLSIESGEVFENNNLTLKTYGTGNIVFDLTGTGSGWLTGTDTSLVFDTRTSTDTDYWMGIIDNANNTDDDLFSIGKGDVTGTTPLLTIDAVGNVGIGTTAPGYELDVYGDIHSDRVFIGTPTFSSDELNVGGQANFDGTIYPSEDQSYNLGGSSYGWYYGYINYIISTNSGDLYLDSAGGQIELQDVFNVGGISNATYNAISDIGGAANLAATDNDLYIQDVLEVDGVATFASNVGVGTTAPAAKLDVLGTGWIRGGTGNSGGIYVNGSGQVGIGTTNPSGELHIEDAASDALLYIKGGAGADGTGVWAVSDLQSILRADTYDDNNGSRLMLQRARGTAASPTALQAGDDIASLEFRGYDTGFSDSGIIKVVASAAHGSGGDSTDAPGDMLFLTTPDGSGTALERMRITSEGNIGIGTTAPNSSLELFGATAGFQMSYDSSNYGKFTIGNDGTLTLAGVSGGGSLTDIARFSTSAVNIDVPTSFNAAGDVSVAYDLYFTNQTASYIKSDGPLSIVSGESFENNDLTLETYGTGNIILKANSGNIWADGTSVGIGTTAPARTLHVKVGSNTPPVRFQDSDGYCEINPTSTTWSCTSDATLKKDVETLSNIQNLQKLNLLRPVSFRWKTQETADKRYGLIAQEVEQLFPEFVQTDEKGLKSVSYGSFTPILISAVQEQQLQLSAQETTLDTLSQQLDLVVNEDTGAVTSTLLDTLAQETQDVEDRTTAIEGEVEALAQKDTQIETRLNTIEDRLNALEQASASASLDTLNDRVGFLEQLFTGIQASGSADLSTYLADLISGQVLGLQSEEATLSALTVSGDTNVNNLGVTGEISSGILTINGFDDTLATPAATISTLGGSLKLQHLGLGDIEFMAGKSKIDTDGNFIMSAGDFVIETGVIKGNDQFRGIDLPAVVGATYLDVDFNAVKDTNEYAVNVTPSWLTNIAVINKRTDGFRIQFSTPAPLNGTVDWMIIE